ncbi:MAG: malate dehydrogenase, partial [Chlamydiae bacterium]|nr:malate dehydrogenase [Chlamydiota bacterium]
RLDQNRAVFQLSQKASTTIEEISHVAIWGNHSSTQVPDFVHAKIHGKPAIDVIRDRNWLEKDFVETIQKRGAAVIQARGKSSAASAANAIIGSIRSITTPTPQGHFFSLAVLSDQNPYNVAPGLVFSFPCKSQGKGDFEIVSGLKLDPFLEQKIAITQKELIEERDLIAHLLKG